MNKSIKKILCIDNLDPIRYTFDFTLLLLKIFTPMPFFIRMTITPMTSTQ